MTKSRSYHEKTRNISIFLLKHISDKNANICEMTYKSMQSASQSTTLLTTILCVHKGERTEEDKGWKRGWKALIMIKVSFKTS